MIQSIDPAQLRLAQLLGENDNIGQIAQVDPSLVSEKSTDIQGAGSPFEAILSKAVDALSNISKTEAHANLLIDKYVHGQADLQDVMVATSKATVMIQMAVTTINLAVNTFKEITQMQV